MTKEKFTVAAFDFDGTITYGDTLAAFLFYALGYPKVLLGGLKKIPILFQYLIGFKGRKETKEEMLKLFFSGVSIEEIEKLATSFSLKKLHKKIRKESLKEIKWHLERKHRLVLVSASLEIYLKPWAKMMGFEEVLASRLEVVNGKVTGMLQGENCRGQEKVRRILEYFGPRDSFEMYAYGNSDGDRDMLCFADFPFYQTMSHD